jgi:hypothetical protein
MWRMGQNGAAHAHSAKKGSYKYDNAVAPRFVEEVSRKSFPEELSANQYRLVTRVTLPAGPNFHILHSGPERLFLGMSGGMFGCSAGF